MVLEWWEFALRLGCAFVFGALVGVERQWRSRMAGMRTNALVATGAALFVLLSAEFVDDVSPTRIAAQVVSGIGFLGAGVILRDGVNVRGLTTAATIWCVGAIGVLAGGGVYIGAGMGAAVVILANLGLRPVSRRLEPAGGSVPEEEAGYLLRVVCSADQEVHVRALLLHALNGAQFTLRSLNGEPLDEDGGKVSVTAELGSPRRRDDLLEQAVGRLSLEPGVSSVSWQVLNETEV